MTTSSERPHGRRGLVLALALVSGAAACAALVDTSDYAGASDDAGADGADGAPAPPGSGGSDGSSGGVVEEASAPTDAMPDGTATGRCDPSKPFGAGTLITELSTVDGNEDGITLTPDELTAYVSRVTAVDGGTIAQILVAGRASDTATFGAPVDALPGVTNESHPTVTPDGNVLFLHRTGPPGTQVIDVTKRTGAAQPFGPTSEVGIVLGADKVDPHVVPNALYFSVYVDSTHKDDLARADRNGLTVSSPTAIASLNGNTYDVAPVASPDELVLYFGSDRASTGTFDIYRTSRPSTSVDWSLPVAIDELNTTSAELPRWISSDDCVLYYSTGKGHSDGTRDLWVARRPH